MLFPLQTLLRKIRAGTSALLEIEEPIRAELFSSERLEQHAESLAAAQHVTITPRAGRRLLPRVLDNGRVLLASYRTIARAIREERREDPGYYLITQGRVAFEKELGFRVPIKRWLRRAY